LGSFVIPVALALRRRDIDPIELLGQVGIDLAKAANPEWRISREDFGDLLQRCVEASGD
jgi:hypothetical protein